MKRLSIVLSVLVILSTLLVSCAPPPAPAPAQPAAPTKAAEAPKAAAPAATEAPKAAARTTSRQAHHAHLLSARLHRGRHGCHLRHHGQAIEIFQKNNPNVKVDIVGIPWTAEGDTKLEAALAAKSDINVFRVTSPNLPRYAKQGVLSNIEPFLTEEDKKDFYPSGFQVANVDGKIWAWPLWVTAISVFANKDIFKERGVDLPTMEKPWTWDQFVEAAKKLTYKKADGTQVYGFGSSSKWGAVEYYPLMYIDGGRILSADGKKFVQNQPEGVSALQKLADLALVHKVTPPDLRHGRSGRRARAVQGSQEPGDADEHPRLHPRPGEGELPAGRPAAADRRSSTSW